MAEVQAVRLTVFDRTAGWILRVYGAVALIALALVPLWFLPAEDAVILFQYSRNLAEHGAITFLANGPRVEGATDFAWMAAVAGAMRVGIPAMWFCAGVNVICLVALAALLLQLASRRVTFLRVLPIAGAIALVPQIFAAAAGFAVLTDAVLLAALVLFVLRDLPAWASLCALLLCLFRPDGVVFAIPLMIALLVRSHERGRCAAAVGALFVLPGMAYFIWRAWYFHELLPLPFYVKSDTKRWLGLLVPLSLHQSTIFLAFAAILLFAALFRSRARERWLLLPLMVCPTLFYWAMRLDQNVGARFFYYLPLGAAIMLSVNWELLAARRTVIFRTALASWLVLLAVPLWKEYRTLRDQQFGELKEIAAGLSRLPVRGTILTSEAGYIPYYSGWITYDAWGLNTPRFAHSFIQSGDVQQLSSDLVVFHPDASESCFAQPGWRPSYQGRTWPHMTRNLVTGAGAARYELWLTSYGSEFYRQRKHWGYGEGDRECWLVRKDGPMYAGITQVLREHHGVGPEEAARLEGQRAGASTPH